MSTLGIIVEYNPFHNGHLFHLNQAKKITGAKTTIAVMSGSFLQRGEPAIVDKWTRTKMALAQGVDLIVELPVIYATQAADWFAFGAVSLLDHLQVDNLVFGSETNSVEILDKIADVLVDEPLQLKKNIKHQLSLGHSYPKALSLSLQEYLNRYDFEVSKPNDILGIQYLQNLKKINSSIKVKTIRRLYAQYHDQEISGQSIASATAIRKTIFQDKNIESIKEVVPQSTYNLLLESFAKKRINHWDNFFRTLLIIANSKTDQQLENIHGVIEGFEKRIKENLDHSNSFDELVRALNTKRYTSARIQRTLLYILLDLTKDKVKALNVENGPQYIRVLGFNETGREYLNSIKHKLEIPLITNIKREKNPMLELDMYAATIYELGFNLHSDKLLDYKQAPIQISDQDLTGSVFK